MYVSLSLCLAFVSLPLLVWQQLEIHRFSFSLTSFFSQIKETAQRLDLAETKGAKRLFNRVNKILNRVDLLVTSLESKEREIIDEMNSHREKGSEEELERDAENLVTVQELIDAVTKLQLTPDSSRLEQIAEVRLNTRELRDILLSPDTVTIYFA
jgi:hypothetical protein